MGLFDDGYEQSLIDASRTPVTRPPAGFFEAFNATYEATKQEDLSTSESLNVGNKRAERRKLIQELAGEDIGSLEGQAVPQMWMSPEARTAYGHEAVKKYQQKITELASRYPEIKSDEDLLKEIVEDSRKVREKTGKVLENTTFSGKVGSFSGAMAATIQDPLVLGSMLFGASTSAGILRTALTEAGIGAASEALIQPFVYRYKQKLGSPYSLEEAATRVAAAGVGSGVLAGGIKATSRGISRLAKPRIEGVDDLLETFERHSQGASQVQRDAAFVLGDYADVLRENPFDLGSPDLAEAHFRATAKALADLDAGNPVDVQDIVRDLEPREELRARIITVREPGARPVPTEDQSLSQFVKNSGGVSVEKAGALRGEYDALFESGGSRAGTVKRKVGKSPDEMAQVAHESGFIDEPDPALLAEALGRDLGGEKVYSFQGSRFERKLDLEVDREFERWAGAQEETYFKELEMKARGILETEDVQIPIGEIVEEGKIFPATRSAREVLAEADSDLKAGSILQDCLLRG
jgi:hypothetical protein